MPVAKDTSASAEAIQVAVWRRLGGAGRLDTALAMSDELREVTACGIRARHPGYTDAQVEWALRRAVLGDDLFARAYPLAPILDHDR